MLNQGDLFILYSEKGDTYLLSFKADTSFSTNLGNVVFKEGLSFGDTILSNKNYKFFVLKPSNFDLIKKVQRKTTILYPKDIGYMFMSTGIGSGSIVAEVGSGSGALTTALAITVGDSGKVYSFERKEEHQKIAIKNIKKYGLEDRVEFILKDVSKDGFGDYIFEALFVDVPEPWDLVAPAKKVILPGFFWVSLSPNFEQVKKTYFKLKEHGFFVEKTVELFEREILVREYGVRPSERMISHTGFLTIARNLND